MNEPVRLIGMLRDGANFGPVQGTRREQCLPIVTDEQRSNGPKLARPFGVGIGRSPGASRRLSGATSPPGAPLQPSERPMPITEYPNEPDRFAA